jgi:hypothetical protein
MHRDILQIRILAISYFIFATGITYLSILPFPVLGTGIALFREGIQSGKPLPPTAFNLIIAFGMSFMTLVLPIVALILGWLLAYNIAKLGYWLLKQQRYSFCVKMAGISILLIPIGTVLGILTQVVLTRASVKELFNYPDSAVKS